MLGGLRVMSKNFVGRTILAIFAGLIVVGFGFFGIRDVFTNFRAHQIATIGAEEIGVQQFRGEYQNELQRLQRQARRPVTNDEALRMGLDRQVLARLLTGAALDQEAQKLGLAASDAEIARIIKADKTFAGLTGVFDQARMDELLRDNGYTEAGYVREQRQASLRRQIAVAVTGGLQLPDVLLAAINIFANETRKADYFVLPAADASLTAAPDEEAIKAYYDLRRDAYRTPQYRKVNLLVASPAEIAKTLPIADEAAQKFYDLNAAQRFAAPEKRAIAQLTFSSREAAEKSASRIAKGESFEAVAADRQAGGVLADLAVTTKADLFDKAVAEAAFALPRPGVTAPVQGQFGWVLLEVKGIEPGLTRGFGEVKEQIKAELAQGAAKGEAQKLHDRIEDLRSAGKTLEQAAEALGLKTQTYVTDAAGEGQAVLSKTAPIPALAGASDLVKAIFASDVGVDNDSVSRKDGGFSWFEVVAIEPSRQPTLDEVKPAVIQSLREANAQRDLAARANELARQIDSGASLAALAAANGVEPRTAQGVKRTGAPGLTEAVVAQIFGLPVGAAGVALGEKGSRVVLKVTDAVTPPLDRANPQLVAVAPQLEASNADDLLEQFVGGLQMQLGAKVNQAALRAAIGAQQ
ncbi:peptidylprolyl isomerase [uncultured Rhodoblastus sp.]|uniref:peptidylprolyl isomerase n=1 Tax=uncultured Rhodoblastus sp. TaxID=543037 RepID=UPI0025D2A53A|nr:peptidylprolyl isomerase [uncultured Rhodoblastus sp.]